MSTMNNYERKKLLLKVIPHCPRCGCKMVAINYPQPQPNKNCISHAAVFYGDGLICFGCRRVESKRREFLGLPKVKQYKIKFNELTGILTFLRHVKRFVNDFIYFKIRGGKPTGRVSHYFR